ncbi:hypothetical protein [Gemmiger sp.]
MCKETFCKFGNIQERDMDLLFLESIVTDTAFVKLLLEKIEKSDKLQDRIFKLGKAHLSEKPFSVLSVELSATDPELGESDITAVIEISGMRLGLLLEDKIDAPAMPEQCERYFQRAQKAMANGNYDDFFVFIICPEKYYRTNSEAAKYPAYVTYEEYRDLLSKKADAISKIHYQQLDLAIRKAKASPNIIINEAAVDFFRKYKIYMLAHYNSLDLRNKDGSNAWWPHYGTLYKRAYIYHKVSDGLVDLTFPGSGCNLGSLQKAADWLKANGMPQVQAVKTSKAAALRIAVPVLNQTEPFENAKESDVKQCFDAIQTLSDFASMLATIHNIT